ncbi:MAG: hypothetical protein WCW17_02485 [Patescibacteria group bacterium]
MKNHEKVLALTHKIVITDEFENRVKKEIIEPVLDQMTFTALNFQKSDPNSKLSIAEKFFLDVDKVVFRLLQCHKHQKNYDIIESERIKELNADIQKTTKFIDECWRPLELNCEIDAFLTKWKSSLDALAKTLIPLYGINSKTWSDKGKKIINQLNNLSAEKVKKIQPLINIIEENKGQIGSIIDLRDKVVHYDTECLTPFHYRLKEKKLHNPSLIWDGNVYMPQDFMTQASEYLLDFTREFIVKSINGFVEALYIVVTTDGHQWFMPPDKIKESK